MRFEGDPGPVSAALRERLAPGGVLRAGINLSNFLLVSARSADGGPAEAELQRQEADRERAEERRTVQATKTLFVDALYRAKRLNGDAAFDMVDMADLESLLRLAGGITERRLSRGSDAP